MTNEREEATGGRVHTAGPVFTAPVDGHWSTDEGTEMANRYVAMDREDLAYGHMTDLELANAVYMSDRKSLDLIVMQTAAKERIRWLSAKLAETTRATGATK